MSEPISGSDGATSVAEPRVILAGSGGSGGEFFDAASVFGGSASFDGSGSGGSGDAGGSGGDDFDPERHAGRDKRNRDGTFRLKRGRNGSGGGSSDKPAKRPRVRDLDNKASGYAAGLYSIHAMLAMRAGEHWAMDEDESKRLGIALANFEQHFPVNIDPKILAGAQLAGALAWAYGPRVVISVNEAKEKRAKDAAPSAEVLHPAFGAFQPG